MNRDELNCNHVHERLMDYCEGHLDDPVCRRLHEHIQNCSCCQRYLRSYRATVRMVRALGAISLPPAHSPPPHRPARNEARPN